MSGGKATARGQADGYRWIEMAPGDVADRIGHGHHREAKCQRHPEQADADLWKAGGNDRASTSSERQPEGTDRFGKI